MLRDICLAFLLVSIVLGFIGIGRLDSPEAALQIVVISLAVAVVVSITDRFILWILRRLRSILILAIAAGILAMIVFVEPLRASLLRDPYTPLVLSALFLIIYGLCVSGSPSST